MLRWGSKQQSKEHLTNAFYQELLMKDLSLKLRLVFNETTYSTKLLDWQENLISFWAPIENLNWVRFSIGQVLPIVFLTQGAVFATELKILSEEMEKGQLYYHAKLLTTLNKRQQRAYYRLATSFEVHYFGLDESDSFQAKGRCMNLSVGGMRLTSELKLTQGTEIDVKFEFLETPFELRATILEDGEHLKEKTYTHRLKFLNLDSINENNLNRVIITRQTQLLKRPK